MSSSTQEEASRTARVEADAACVAGVIAGEPRAFRSVYDLYAPRLYTFLLRMTHDDAEARDLAQDVWLRLARSAPSLRPDTGLGAWLFTVARNAFRSRYRLRVLDRQRLYPLGLVTTPSTPPSQLLDAAERDLSRALECGLASLAVPQRETLLLHAVEGFSSAEIARMLQLDETVIRKRLSRARAALREHMKEAL